MLITALVLGLSPGLAAPPHRTLTDFAPGGPVEWITVNDTVMGGRSRGGFEIDAGTLRFTGETNTRGGGFSSIRSRPVAFDLRAYDGIRLRLRADGRRYTFRLESISTQGLPFQPAYWAEFDTPRGPDWATVDVSFTDFRPQWRGQRLPGPALDLRRIEGLGLMIYDKQDGPFRLEVDWIQAYRDPGMPSLAEPSSHRPLLLFAPQADDPRLVAQLEAVRVTRAAFDARDMLLVVVLAAGPPPAGVDAVGAADAARLRERYGVPPDGFAVRLVGKDGGLKRAAEAVVDLAPWYALIDTMPMRQQEMRDGEAK